MGAGRPTKMTENTVNKLEEAFAMGCTDLEACLFADISKKTLYNYQDKNPEFIHRKEQLKQKPFLIARASIMNGMKEDPKLALDYMKNKKSDEFKTNAKHEKQNLDEHGNPIDPKSEFEVVFKTDFKELFAIDKKE